MEFTFELYHYGWLMLLAAGVTVYILSKKKKLTMMEFLWVTMFIFRVRSAIKKETGTIRVTAVNPKQGVYRGKMQFMELDLFIEFVYTNDGFEFLTINLPDEVMTLGVGYRTPHYKTIATIVSELSIPYINKLKETSVDVKEADKK